MSEHTPEPWRVHKITPEPGIPTLMHGNVAVKVDGDDKVVAVCGHPGRDEPHANARRIVACVNALAGVPDPAAYVAAFDAMLAACERADRGLATAINEPLHTDREHQCRVARVSLRAAIADARKAKGGE